jgi:hypothetical protein
MYKDVLRTIAGIEVFPLVSLVVFVAVFMVMLVLAWRMDDARLVRYASLPLDETPPPAVPTPPRTAEETRRG